MNRRTMAMVIMIVIAVIFVISISVALGDNRRDIVKESIIVSEECKKPIYKETTRREFLAKIITIIPNLSI